VKQITKNSDKNKRGGDVINNTGFKVASEVN
jgi:hypothetical protein